jgi:hypothetical protein
MDFFNKPEDPLWEAECWFAIEEVLAREQLEAGREIDRQIAKLQQMQRETAERFEKSKELRNTRLTAAPCVRTREPELWGFIHWMRWLREYADRH